MVKKIFLRTLCISLSFVSFYCCALEEKAATNMVARVDEIDKKFNTIIALPYPTDLGTALTSFSTAVTSLSTNYTAMQAAAIPTNGSISKFMQDLLNVIEKILPIKDYIAKLGRIKTAASKIGSVLTTEKTLLTTQKNTFVSQRAAFLEFERTVREKTQQTFTLPAGYQVFVETFEGQVTKAEAAWKNVLTITAKLNECKDLITSDLLPFVATARTKIDTAKSFNLGVSIDVPVVLAISSFNFGVWNSTNAVRIINEENVKSFENNTNNLTFATLPGVSTSLTTILDAFKTILTNSKTPDVSTFTNFNPTQVSFSGKALGIEFTDAKLYEVVDQAIHCFGGYVKLSSVPLVPNVISFKDLHLFHTNCSAMTMNALKDRELLEIFKNITVKEGTFFRTDVDISFIKNLLTGIPFIASVFSVFPPSIPMSGVVTTLAESFKGTKLNYVPSNATIAIPQVGSLTLESIGVEIAGGLTAGTVKAKLPLKGKLKLFDQDFSTDVVVDFQPLSALVSGQYKGGAALFGTGITLKNPGLAANISAAGGVTGVGVTGDITFGGKTISVMTYGNLTGADLAISGSISSISLKDVITSLKNLGDAPTKAVTGVALSTIDSLFPNVSLSNCSVSIAPSDLTIFDKTYKKGVTVKGSATYFGKTCTVNITVDGLKVFADIEVDSLDFTGVVKISGKDTNKLKLVLDTAGNGFFSDVKVELLAKPFIQPSGTTFAGKINIAPQLIKISDLTVNLPGFGQCTLDLSAQMPLAGWSFKATLADAAKKTLGGNLTDSLKSMNECFNK